MGARLFAVVAEPISAAALEHLVTDPGAGAICSFEGTVRDHTGDTETEHLEYEAHASMAEKVFEALAAEAERRWGISRMAIHHRVGELQVGEVSVAIAVSAPHRAAAFEACRFAIDELKRRAPIWKKEFGPDGSFWVEGPASDDLSTAAPAADSEGERP